MKENDRVALRTSGWTLPPTGAKSVKPYCQARGSYACDSHDSAILHHATLVPATVPELHNSRALHVWHSFCSKHSSQDAYREIERPYQNVCASCDPRNVYSLSHTCDHAWNIDHIEYVCNSKTYVPPMHDHCHRARAILLTLSRRREASNVSLG